MHFKIILSHYYDLFLGDRFFGDFLTGFLGDRFLVLVCFSGFKTEHKAERSLFGEQGI
jgi:hypothetical protein